MASEHDIERVEAELLRRVRSEGVVAAYEASLSICRDPKSPAPARATASATLFRVAGYFSKDNAPVTEKESQEMSAEELNQAIREVERKLSSKKDGSADDSDDDIFG